MSLRAGDVLLSPEVVGHIVTWLPVKDVKVCELTCKQSNVVRGQHGAWGELLSRDEALVGESSWYSKNVLVPHDAYLYRRTGKVPPMWWAHTIASTAGVFWRNLTHTTLLTRLFWRQTNPYAPGTPSLSDNPRNLRRMTLTQKISGVPLLLIALPFILLYNVGVTLSKHLKSAADGLCSKAKTLHTSATTTYHKACTAVMARYQAYAAEPSIRFKTAAARYFRLLKAKLASICDNIKVRVRKVKDRGLEAFQEYVKSPLQRGMSHVRKTGAACQAKNKALFGVVRSAVRNYHQTYIGRPCARFSAAVTQMKVKLVSVCDALKARVSKVKDKGLETFQNYVKSPMRRGMSHVRKTGAACQAKSIALFGVVKANLKALGVILIRFRVKAVVKFSAVWHEIKIIGGKCLVVLEKIARVVNQRVFEPFVKQPFKMAEERVRWAALRLGLKVKTLSKKAIKSFKTAGVVYFAKLKEPLRSTCTDIEHRCTKAKMWLQSKWCAAHGARRLLETFATWKIRMTTFYKNHVLDKFLRLKNRISQMCGNYVTQPCKRCKEALVKKWDLLCEKLSIAYNIVRNAARNYYRTYIGGPCARFSAAVTRMKVKLVSVCDAIKARVSRVKDKGLETFQKYVKIPLQRGMSRVGKVRAACQAKSEAEFGVVKANLKVLGKILMRLKKKAAVKFSAVWHVVKVIGGKCLVVLEKTERVVNHVAGAVVWELRNKKVIMFVRIQETCEQTRESARKLKRRSYLWYYNEQALCIEEAVHLEHYNLGHIGGLLKVSLKGTYAQLKGLDMGVMPNGPLPVIVFDRSASMGLWCHAALKNALPQAFSELGYAPSQRVIVLAFNSALEVYDTRLSQLANLNITAQGGTCIFDALQYLTRIIANHDDLKTPLNVLVVSDGQVADKDRAVAYTRDTVSANCDRSVNVGLLRIKTRDDDNPDTRAMACIGAFSTTGRTGVIDVDLRDELPGSEHGVALVRRAVVGSLKHSSAMSTTLTVDGGAAPLPSVNAQKTITVSTAHASYVYVAQSSMTEATVGGIVCSVQEMGRPHTEEVLHGSLECLENQLKIWQVVGICDDRTIVNEVQQRIVKWLMALKQIMYETPAEELRVSTRDRVKKLLTEYEKRKKSVCVRLLQMSTADCVSALNSAQQADYLRTSVTKQTKKLACRAKHKDEELGFDDLCKRVVSNVLALEFPEEDRAEDVSFYSQTSMCEVLQAVEEVVHVADDILSDDLLKIVGGLGVPYCAHVAEYPDPWRYRITEMYTGMLINESDLWTAHRQGGGVPLECPGRQGSLITGVIPLNKGKAMEFYNRKMTDLAELQAAVCMRRKMARVSGDIIAREAAGVLYCVEQMGIAGARHTNELEVTADLMNSMAHKLHHSTALTDLTLRLRSAADIRTLLIGINDISGILKPAMCLIRGCIERSRPQDRMTAAHSRALYEFGSYHAAREAFHGLASREQELHRVLDINFYAENELRVDHLKQYVGQLQWVPNMEHVAALFRAARLPPLVTPDRLVSLPSVTLHETFGFEEGFDMDTYKAGVVVMSLMSAKEQDRVKDNVCLTPQFTDMADVWRYLTDVRSKIFKKHKDEAERRLIETLRNKASNAKLIEMVKCSVASFAELLQTDAKREELPRLLRMLAGKNANVVAHGVQKLHILLTGVDSEGKAYGITPCRHIMKHKNSAVRLASKEYWEDLLKTHSVQIMKGYRYRQDTPNRHSHGNDKMSFWALGYPSLDVMQELNPAGYKEYVTAHTDCCGFRRRS